jgi:ribose transport system ATP-binding protein
MDHVLHVEGLSKSFARTRALSGLSLTVDPGEVHVLLGHNGSGKSTLIKILSGYHAPDPGALIRIAGHELTVMSPGMAYRLGCRFVQQDLGLIANLSVLDNLAIGSGFPTRLATIRRKASLKRARQELDRVGLAIDPLRAVSELTASERTGVAVARALRADPDHPAKLVVLDEPTATLPVDEVENLLDMVRQVAADGVGVLYVTHHLGEVFRIADQVTVLRDGIVAGTGPAAAFDHASLVRLLAGDEYLPVNEPAAADRRAPEQTPLLDIRQLRGGSISDVSLAVHRGEVVGIAGLSGSGREAVLGTVFGARRPEHGEVLLDGEPLPPGRPDRSIARGVAYLAADRKQGGGVMGMTARENISLPNLKPFWNGFRLRKGRERRHTSEWFARLSIRPVTATEEPLGTFSGGNQQKILFAKWLSRGPTVFLLDEPTQGVDVGAKADLHRELIAVAGQGAAVVISSSDLDELADLSDRVVIMSQGRIVAELDGAAADPGAITRRMSAPVAAADGNGLERRIY